MDTTNDEREALRTEAERVQRAAWAEPPLDPPSWDDRKELLDVWQEHAPLPSVELRDGIYDALIAVAYWGYKRGTGDGA